MKRVTVSRFSFSERLIHWTVGLTFVFLLLTGLAFSHPSLFWLTALVGGGGSARVLHPWVGLVYSVALIAMILVWMKDMRVDARDRAWLKTVHHYARHDKKKVPAAGKYNGGQKVFFWLMAALGLAHLFSGVPMWFPQGIAGMGPFVGWPVNWMRLIHYVTTVGGGLLLIVHVYLGTAAFPGTLRGMLHGDVTPAWARLHHADWTAEVETPAEISSESSTL